MAKVAIFGNGLAREGSFEWESAKYLGEALSSNGFDIITGGYAGVMEAAFINCSNNVKKIGVITENSEPNKYVSEIVKTKDYINRLLKLLELADAYIVLPGGTGTFLEFAAVWALTERDIIKDKPLITVGEMWNELIQTMAFYNESIVEHFDKVATTETAEDAAFYLISYFNDRITNNGSDI